MKTKHAETAKMSILRGLDDTKVYDIKHTRLRFRCKSKSDIISIIISITITIINGGHEHQTGEIAHKRFSMILLEVIGNIKTRK